MVGGTHPQAAALLRALGHSEEGTGRCAGWLREAGHGELGRVRRALLGQAGGWGCDVREVGSAGAVGRDSTTVGPWGGKRGEVEREHGPAEEEGGRSFSFFFFTLSFFHSFYLDIMAYLYTYACTCSF